MDKIDEIRRQNLRILIESHHGTIEDFASTIGVTLNYLNDRIKPEKTKKIGDTAARRIEKKRGRPRGWLDERHATPEETKTLERFLEFPPAHIDRAFTLTELAQHSELFASILAALEPVALCHQAKLLDKQQKKKAQGK